MKYIKKMPYLLQYLLILVLTAQIILSPYLVSAQEAGPLLPMQVTQSETGLLDIEVNVSGAVITIDQQKKGKAPLHDITLSPGVHKVVVSKKGYVSWSEDLIIEPGAHLSIVAVLRELGQVEETKIQPVEKLEELSPPAAIGPEAATSPKAQEGGLLEKQKVDLGLSTGRPAESSKAFYKTWWFWTLVVLAAGGAAAAGGGGGGGGGGQTTGTITITGPAP